LALNSRELDRGEMIEEEEDPIARIGFPNFKSHVTEWTLSYHMSRAIPAGVFTIALTSFLTTSQSMS
jgi:hypothetical protein